MSNEHISLTPELLLSQAAEMTSLRQEYAQMFQQVSKNLSEINGSWSEYLANNFQGKIQSVQKGLSNVLGMLDNGSAAARLSASDLSTLDGTLGKQLGSDGAYESFAKIFGEFWDEKRSGYKEVMHGVDQFDKDMREKFESLPEGMQKYIEKMLINQLGLSDAKTVYEVINLMADGDYGGASQKIGKKGLDEYFAMIYGVEGVVYSDFAYNWLNSTSEALTEAYLNPTAQNIAHVGWNMTVQPVLDTCGEYVWNGITIGDVTIPGVSAIPSISDFYYEHGAHDFYSAANVVLTEGYRMILGDEAADYAQSYYADHGGVFQGVYDGMVEIGGYTAEQIANAWHSIWN